MAILSANCPHCHALNMTFLVFGAKAPDKNSLPGEPKIVSVAAECRNCGLPVVAVYESNNINMSQESLQHVVSEALQMGRNVADSSVVLTALWPEPAKLQIPEHLPPDVARALTQAEKNFHQPDCEEAAAMMYRRSLEVGLKSAYPDKKGSLADRIKSLVTEHHLPTAIGDWLNQVRIIGNEGAHEIGGVSREDLVAARGFVDMALRYIFTLPAQVAERRGSTATVA